MKTIISIVISIVIAHQLVGALMASDTVKTAQSHKVLIENAMEVSYAK